jgi:hypothetical protein
MKYIMVWRKKEEIDNSSFFMVVVLKAADRD